MDSLSSGPLPPPAVPICQPIHDGPVQIQSALPTAPSVGVLLSEIPTAHRFLLGSKIV
jgi:hypothetical protein